MSKFRLAYLKEFAPFSFTLLTWWLADCFKATATAFAAFWIDLCIAAVASEEEYSLATGVEPAFKINYHLVGHLHLLEFTDCFRILNLGLIDSIGNWQRKD